MTDPAYIVLGDRIRARREKLGLTQQELAEAVGLSRTSVTNIERGRQAVLVHQLAIFAKALGVRTASLIPNDDEAASLGRSAPEDEIAEYLSRLRLMRA